MARRGDPNPETIFEDLMAAVRNGPVTSREPQPIWWTINARAGRVRANKRKNFLAWQDRRRKRRAMRRLLG